MSAHLPECLNERARRIDGFFCCCDVLERHKRRLAADYERDVAAAEERGWNAAVRQLAGEGCTWADGDCPNGTDCLSCKNLDALITERAKGDVEVWNAAVDACRQATAGVPLHVGSSDVRAWQLEAWADIDGAIAALRKDTGREVGG